MRRGFTLVELLVAMAVTLLLMGFVTQIFVWVSESISGSRAAVELSGRMRAVRDKLQSDLAGATARMLPPLSPADGLGYFEIIEGPIGPCLEPRGAELPQAVDEQSRAIYDIDGDWDVDEYDFDSTRGDTDDVLMLTTRSLAQPFVGLHDQRAIESHVAEVAWFVRGTTLYRRQLLVRPDIDLSAYSPTNFYGGSDISVRQVGGPNDRRAGASPNGTIVPNTLGDLTRRENRFGHQPWSFPHDARLWGELGLPTLRECSFHDGATGLWPFPLNETTLPLGSEYRPSEIYYDMTNDAYSELIVPDVSGASISVVGTGPDRMQRINLTKGSGEFDAWDRPFPWDQVDPVTGTINSYMPTTPTEASTRVAEDVMLTDVLSFDVKVWDPGAPILSDGTHIYAPGDTTYIGDPGYLQFLDSNPSPTITQVTGFGAYVDLNYMCVLDELAETPAAPDERMVPNYTAPANAPRPRFHGAGDVRSRLRGTTPFDKDFGDRTSFPDFVSLCRPAVYDTWCTDYERDGFNQDQDGATDEGTDGIDNNVTAPGTSPYAHGLAMGVDSVAGVDDADEQEAPPPYDAPLRGVQIKVRAFERDSRHVIEYTVIQEFLPE